MAVFPAKLLRVILTVLFLGGLYLLAVHKHAERDELRKTSVDLTPSCNAKLQRYQLVAAEDYRSPYVRKMTGAWSMTRGYSEDDVRAIQRGCNVVDDLQGYKAKSGSNERWNAARYVRGTQTTCAHCHQHVGDKQDTFGNRIVGSNNLG